MNDRIPGSAPTNPIIYRGWHIWQDEPEVPNGPAWNYTHPLTHKWNGIGWTESDCRRKIDNHFEMQRESWVRGQLELSETATVFQPTPTGRASAPSVHEGQLVLRQQSDYLFIGIVLSIFPKLNGVVRCAVEDDRGIIHIMNPSSLKAIGNETEYESFYLRRSLNSKRLASEGAESGSIGGMALRKASDGSTDSCARTSYLRRDEGSDRASAPDRG